VTSEEAGSGRLSAPGNLLLLGEYAVVEPGGLGLAVAVEPRVAVSWRPGERLTVVGRGTGREIVWPGPEAALFDAIVATLSAAGLEATVVVDSGSFYAGGRKKGYGSSAAVAAGLTAALLFLLEGHQVGSDRVFHNALEAHRLFQGGRGSGYDVAASVYGGIGVFTGGQRPIWAPVELDWLPPLGIFSGTAPVATSGAIGRYREWERRNHSAAKAFVRRSNRLVSRFVRAGTWARAGKVWRECRLSGARLGLAIDVPADIEPPFRDNPHYKAVGAGNELGVVIGPADGVEPVTVSPEGLRWE
jgi:phosphomevalonate kinase